MLFCPKAPGVEQRSCVTLGTRQTDSPMVLAAVLSPELAGTLGSRCSPSIDFRFSCVLVVGWRPAVSFDVGTLSVDSSAALLMVVLYLVAYLKVTWPLPSN